MLRKSRKNTFSNVYFNRMAEAFAALTRQVEELTQIRDQQKEIINQLRQQVESLQVSLHSVQETMAGSMAQLIVNSS